MYRLRTTLILIALAALVGCATGELAKPKPDGVVSPAAKYLIGASDVLTITVLNHEELNRTVTVRPDGKLSFSLVGDIPAAGLEPKELQTLIEAALRNYMRIVPGEVSVAVDAVHSFKVSVMGEVRLPGRFEFQNQVSVLDALAQAGGLTEFASGDRILILRRYQGLDEKIVFDYPNLIRSKNSKAPVLLYPGDIILVP